MTDNVSEPSSVSGSAKIYAFPRRGRFALENAGDGIEPVTNAQLGRGVKIAAGSAWYHEAAIQDAVKADRGASR